MKVLTVFTPTYNRKHTLPRVYESLLRQTCKDFDWLIIDDGSSDGTESLVSSWMEEKKIPIRYIWQKNGGLHTGYNTAYANIDTELCVCIDSDDFMPDNAVEVIIGKWNNLNHIEKQKYCGILGLDFNVKTGKPIGGYLPDGMTECYYTEICYKKIHVGDMKQVMRTDLMKEVAPMPVFEGEKNFNPYYMLMQVLDKYPILVINDNLCWVEYQETDSMSAGIWRQYYNSPHSFAEYRRMELKMTHGNSIMNKYRICAHLVSSCLLSGEYNVFRDNAEKVLTLLAIPTGIVLASIVLLKN